MKLVHRLVFLWVYMAPTAVLAVKGFDPLDRQLKEKDDKDDDEKRQDKNKGNGKDNANEASSVEEDFVESGGGGGGGNGCDVTGTYTVLRGHCDFGIYNQDFPDGILEITSERNTISLRPGLEDDDQSWIVNNVTAPYEPAEGEGVDFEEEEHCTRDMFALSAGPVYDCLTTVRSDMDRPNVILRYTWNGDCTEFYKMVQVTPGAEPGVVPHICKILAVKVNEICPDCDQR